MSRNTIILLIYHRHKHLDLKTCSTLKGHLVLSSFKNVVFAHARTKTCNFKLLNFLCVINIFAYTIFYIFLGHSVFPGLSLP
jgi:hypothetical protein